MDPHDYRVLPSGKGLWRSKYCTSGVWGRVALSNSAGRYASPGKFWQNSQRLRGPCTEDTPSNPG